MLGGLIVIERHIGLAEYVEVGVWLDAVVSRKLLVSLFQPPGPLHDGRGHHLRRPHPGGGMPACPFPPIPEKGSQYGTRHRAALGLSEETDAVCVVVSEERGRVSVAVAAS